MNKQYTTKQIAEGLNTTTAVANGVLQFLVARGAAKAVGKVVTGKVGKPAVIYEVNDNIQIDLSGVPTYVPVDPVPPKPKAAKVKAEKPEPVAVAENDADNAPIGTLIDNPAS
jgi:hypothetical protein